MATKSQKNQQLTLHELLGALSFWGTATRLLLFAFFVAAIFALRLTYLDTSLVWETQIAIYVLSSFAILDISYVALARAMPLKRSFDATCLLLSELFITSSYILPNLINVGALGWFSTWMIFIVLLVVSIRALLGLLFSSNKRA